MGNDTPLAVLSNKAPVLYNYFKQLFAQVTNPPLDAIREELVTSLKTTIGSESNLFEETPEQCRLLHLDQPILTNRQMQQIKELDRDGFRLASPVDPLPGRAKGRREWRRRSSRSARRPIGPSPRAPRS